jgi:hypothetical protein
MREILATATVRAIVGAMSVAPAPIGSSARRALVISTAVLLGLYLLAPIWGFQYVTYPMRMLSTLVHELGHGIAALLAGGTFTELHMYADGSGVAYAFAADSWGPPRAFVSAGGLCGPAAVAAGMFVLARRPKWARACLFAFGGFLALALALWVRNEFGVVFTGLVVVATIATAFYVTAETAQVIVVFLAVQLAISVYTDRGYLFMKEAVTGHGTFPSDSQAMAESLGGTYWMWGIACGAFSALVLALGAWLFLRGAARD